MPSQRHLCRIFACILIATPFARAHSERSSDVYPIPYEAQAAPSEAPDLGAWIDQFLQLPLLRFFMPVAATQPGLELASPIPACLVAPLPGLTDTQSLEFESSAGSAAVVDLDGLTPTTARALKRFQRIVLSAGGSLAVTSAFRPAAYQDHLQAVWDKWMLELRNNEEPGCQELKAEVQEEFARHQLLASQRPASISDHTKGISFDASVFLPKRKRRGSSLDWLARKAGVKRPVISRDPVHFRLIGA